MVQNSDVKPSCSAPVVTSPEIDESPWDNDGLTIRSRAFVEALVGPAGGNATKAAQMAGYRDDNLLSLQVTASRLLSNAMVGEAIARALARRRMTPEWAQDRLLELASASMRNFVDVDQNGNMAINWKKAVEVGAIGQIGEVREETIETGGQIKTIKRTFKLHNPAKAVETVLKLHGKLIDRRELTGKDGGPIETELKKSFDVKAFVDELAAELERRAGQNAVARRNGNGQSVHTDHTDATPSSISDEQSS